MPEMWLLDKILTNDNYLNNLAELTGYNKTQQLAQYLNEVKSLLDQHDLGFELSNRTNIGEKEIMRNLVMAVKNDEELKDIASIIQGGIDGGLPEITV